MAWVELHICTTAKHADKIGHQLTAYGAQALTMQDAGDVPVFGGAFNRTPALWPETKLTGLFDDQQDLTPLTDYLAEEQAAGHLQTFTVSALPDEDWERRCLDSFQPLCFGKRLWVCPSWQEPPDPNAVNVILDPGLAFGTGTHPTTSVILDWLDENIQSGETLIDYGCGSGILAIAALKLGARHAIAVDLDPKALTATLDNAELNQIPTNRLKICSATDFNPTEKVDLIVANILAQPLIQLAPVLAGYVKNQGIILLSGILNAQTAEISKIYNKFFHMEVPVSKEEWSLLKGIRRENF